MVEIKSLKTILLENSPNSEDKALTEVWNILMDSLTSLVDQVKLLEALLNSLRNKTNFGFNETSFYSDKSERFITATLLDEEATCQAELFSNHLEKVLKIYYSQSQSDSRP